MLGFVISAFLGHKPQARRAKNFLSSSWAPTRPPKDGPPEASPQLVCLSARPLHPSGHGKERADGCPDWGNEALSPGVKSPLIPQGRGKASLTPPIRAKGSSGVCLCRDSPGGQLTLLEPFGDLARGQPSPTDPGGLAGELLLFMKS